MGLVSFAPRSLYRQGKRIWYPLDRRLGGPQNRSGHSGEKKNSLPLLGLEPPDHPYHRPVLYHYQNYSCPCALTEHHAMKAYWGSGGIASLLWPRHLMEMSGQLHAPATLPPGKEPLVLNQNYTGDEIKCRLNSIMFVTNTIKFRVSYLPVT
jgi:hypothetical protein